MVALKNFLLVFLIILPVVFLVLGFLALSFLQTYAFWPVLVFVLVPIGIGVFGFWLWMLVDLLKRPHFEDKVIWALVLLFIQIIGSILYYFLVYSKKKSSKK